MNEELLVGFYWDSLSKAEAILNDLSEHQISPTPEVRLVKGLAFAGLIRNHVKFLLIQPDKEVTKTKKVAFLSITKTEENEDFVEPKAVIRDLTGVDHECDLELLKQILGPDYDRLVLGKAMAASVQMPPAEIVLADISEEPEKEEDRSSTAGSVIREPKEPERPKDRLPVFEKDGRFKGDIQSMKLWDTFTYNHHEVTLDYNGEHGTIHFYVYPLAIKQNELSTDIVVVAESGETCRANVSRGNVSSVELSFGAVPFVIRGSFQNGEFSSIVRVMLPEVSESVQERIFRHEAKVRTSTTYVQSEYHGVQFNIFPAKFKIDGSGNYMPANASNGYAPAAIVIERERHVEVLTPTSEGTFNVLGNNGESILVETYWSCPEQGHTFNYRFDE